MTNDTTKPRQLSFFDTIEIPLSKNGKKHKDKFVTTVDVADSDLTNLNWNIFITETNQYACRAEKGANNHTTLYLHRVILSRILGRSLEKGEQVDHINGNGLDNRRCNLRLATHAQNQRNRNKHRDQTSGFKGVTRDKSKNKWKAQITVNRHVIHLGYFDVIESAYQAYCTAAKEYFGEFANID